MNISTVAPYQTTSLYAKSTAMKMATTGARVFKVPEVATTTQKGSSTVYEELSGKYDVRNATFGEIVEMSEALYNAGEITLAEHATLTFDYDRATENLKRHAPGYISADFNLHETLSNRNGQRDWIAEFRARASKNFKIGNLVGYQSDMKAVEILERLLR